MSLSMIQLQRCGIFTRIHSSSLILSTRSIHSSTSYFNANAAATTTTTPTTTPAANFPPLSANPSPTELILNVLSTGPKTRKQIFYAINRGPPAASPATASSSSAASSTSSSKSNSSTPATSAHAYPTGILRNPTHLSAILRKLTRGSRVWAKPYASMESRLGENEKNSIAAIGDKHAAPAAKTIVKPSASWLYVLRDWADPSFGSKAIENRVKSQAKRARQLERRENAAQQAIEAGKPFLLGRAPAISRTAQRNLDAKAKKEEEKKRLNKAVREYHEELGLKVKKVKKAPVAASA